MKINRLEIPKIVRAYTIEFIPAIELACRYGVTRAAIYGVLKRAGVNTSYQEQSRIRTVCDHCGANLLVIRSIFRKRLHSFCGAGCYHAWLASPKAEHMGVKKGHSMAKKVIEDSGFFVEYGTVIHWEDDNEANNEVHNLKVFKNQEDHTRYHRCFEVSPMWDGSLYENKPSPEKARETRHIATAREE